MKRTILTVAVLGAFSLQAVNYSWQGGDGAYDAGANWGGTAPSAATDEAVVGPGQVLVTFPTTATTGVYTNFSRFSSKVQPGERHTFDGTGSVYAHPHNNAANYPYQQFRLYNGIYANDGNNRDTVLYVNNIGKIGGVNADTTGAQYELTDFRFYHEAGYVMVNSQSKGSAKVVFEKGVYNFLNPCGEIWDKGQSTPHLYFFNFAKNNNSTAEPVVGRFEAVVQTNATIRAYSMGIQPNAYNNTVTFDGSKDNLIGIMRMPANVNGWVYNRSAVPTDLTLDNGAEMMITNTFFICDSANDAELTERINVRNGSKLVIPQTYHSHGTAEINVDGGELLFGLYGLYDQKFNYKGVVSTTFNFSNKAKVTLDHIMNGKGFYLGVDTADAATEYRHFLNCSDSTFTLKSGSRFYFYGARCEFSNNSLIENDGWFRLLGNGLDNVYSRMIVDHSTVSNRNTFCIGEAGKAKLEIKNGSRWVTTVNQTLGGNANHTTTAAASDVDVEISDSTVEFIGSAGGWEAGSAPNSTVNILMESGLITSDRSTVTLELASRSPGSFTMNGGKVELFRPRAAANILGDAARSGEESVVTINGGEFVNTCQGNGAYTGFALGGESNGGATDRRVRLVLNGGTLSTYTVYGGVSAQCVGGTGYVAFEANGGTIRPYTMATSVLLSRFDEAKVGPLGLTVDSRGFDNTLAQAVWADKDGEHGALIFTGATGSTTLTGDVTRVSNIIADGGTLKLDMMAVPEVQNLTVRNGGKVVVDPAKAIAVTGALTLDGTSSLALTTAGAAEDVFDIFEFTSEPPAATLEALNAASAQGRIINLGIGLKGEFTAEPNGKGGYTVKLSVKEPSTTVIRLDEGVSNATENVVCHPLDNLEAAVAAGSALTLSGTYSSASFVKTGLGKITLDDFARISADDIQFKAGVIEVTGPNGGAKLDKRITLTAESVDDVAIIKNEVDLEMPAPVGAVANQNGEFVKRGAGRLTFDVNGTKAMCGGWGKASSTSSMTWAWNVSAVTQLAIDATSGMITSSSGVAPFTVMEGEVVFQGVGEGAKVSCGGDVCVGASTTAGTVQPGLVIDNCHFHLNNYPHTWVHLGAAINNNDATYGRTGDMAVNAYITLRNGATLQSSQFEMGRHCAGSDVEMTLTVDNSTLNPGNYFSLNRAYDRNTHQVIRTRNNSRVFTRSFYVWREADAIFDDTVIAQTADYLTDPAKRFIQIRPELESEKGLTTAIKFVNGTRLYCDRINPGALTPSETVQPIRLIFDNAEWIPTNSTEMAYTFGMENPAQLRIVAEGRGLKLTVPNGAVWTMNQPITGTGGLIKEGDGTLKLGADVAAFGGTARMNAGTLDLSEAGEVASLKVAGAGTLKDAQVDSLVYDATAGSAPVLDGVTAGTYAVDFGHEMGDRMDLDALAGTVIARFTGDAPELGTIKAKGTGYRTVHLALATDAVGGTVTITGTTANPGMILIVK